MTSQHYICLGMFLQEFVQIMKCVVQLMTEPLKRMEPVVGLCTDPVSSGRGGKNIEEDLSDSSPMSVPRPLDALDRPRAFRVKVELKESR